MTLYLTDGLGNQMFQYSFARYLSIEKGCNLYLNKDLYNYVNYNGTKRNYGLSSFKLSPDVIVEKGLASKLKAFIFGRFKLPIFRRAHSVSSGNYYGKHLIYTQTSYVYSYYNLNPIEFSKHSEIFGQFQTAKWFDKIDKIIKSELKVIKNQSIRNKQINDKISKCESVCLHIRRGDYLNVEWKILNVCNYDYYYKSMKYIKSKLNNPVFFCFSNSHSDIEWIKNNYDFSEFNVVYVDENNLDYEELRLMYSCKHFIISNSTFSWWAQYLSEYQEKIVCAPSLWNKENTVDFSNIYMDNWNIIQVT